MVNTIKVIESKEIMFKKISRIFSRFIRNDKPLKRQLQTHSEKIYNREDLRKKFTGHVKQIH